MFALGELIRFFIYLILSIPPIIAVVLIIIRGRKFSNRNLILLSISSIPLVLFSYNVYSNHRKAELQYVGIYILNNYEKCDSCILELKKNNSFTVTDQEVQIEKGKWKYRSGSDYWIVDIGNYGQLGTGKYKYSESNKGPKK